MALTAAHPRYRWEVAKCVDDNAYQIRCLIRCEGAFIYSTRTISKHLWQDASRIKLVEFIAQELMHEVEKHLYMLPLAAWLPRPR